MNIAQLLEQLTIIFPISDQDLELLTFLKKMSSILSDPSLELSEDDSEVNPRYQAIQSFIEGFQKITPCHKLSFLLQKINTLFSNSSFSSAEKIQKITELLNQTRTKICNDSKTSFRIRELLTDNSLNIEQKRNELEAFLINMLSDQQDIANKNRYKLSLKIALYDRGYYFDQIGQLESELLTLPCGKALNPNIIFSDNPMLNRLAWQYINSIRSKVSPCFDSPESYCLRVERLADIIGRLVFQLEQLEPDSNFNEIKPFISKYLKTCHNRIKSFLVERHEYDWSLWSSAALESIHYLNYIQSESYFKYTGGKHDKKIGLQAHELEIHHTRARYFISQSKLFHEPIGHYVHQKLFPSTVETAPMQTDHLQEESIGVTIDLFTKAHCILLNYKSRPHEISQALECVDRLEDQSHSLGKFIRYTNRILTHPLSEAICNEYLSTLQKIAIPQYFRNEVADLWLCLADFFYEQDHESHPFMREASFLCIDQITEAYPPLSLLNAKLKRAQFHQKTQECESLLANIAKLKESSDFESTIRPSTNPKLNQVILCQYHSKSGPITVDSITALLKSNNPYCNIEVILLLASDSTDKAKAVEAIKNVYDEKHTNPLLLCQTVFKKTTLNFHFVIWSKLLLNEKTQDYLPEVELWKANNYSNDNIRFKILNDVRNKLRLSMYQQEACVIPGGCNTLTDLDTELHEITTRIIFAHHQDTRSNAFAFARNRDGLLEAIYALLFLEDRNYYGALMMAQLSIMKAPSVEEPLTSPKTRTPPPASVSEPSDDELRTPKKSLFSIKSKVTSPRKTFTLPSTRFASSSPALTKIPRKSAKHKAAENIRITPPKTTVVESLSLSPRSVEADNHHSDNTHPTCLGHLIRAIVIWDTKLKENRDRQKEDLNSFKESLKSARLSTNPQELNFILGMIWLNYFDSNPDRHSGRDSIWLTTDEILSLDDPSSILSGDRLAYVKRTGSNLEEQCIIEIINNHFDSACVSRNGTSSMFPPAILAIYQHLSSYHDEFSCGDSGLAQERHRRLAKLLKEAVLKHGYLPALPRYAENYNYAEGTSVEEKILSTEETALDRLKRVQEAYLLAEKCIHVNIDRKNEIETRINQVHQEERRLETDLERYSVETPKKIDSQLLKLNFEIIFYQSSVQCKFIMTNTNPVRHSLVLTFSSKKNEHALNDCELLKRKFERSAFIYSYCKKVSFSKDEPIISTSEKQIIIRHIDIAIIGLIRTVEAKDTFLKWDQSQIEPLIQFLQDAALLPAEIWQWDHTYTRLQGFVSDMKLQNKTLM